MGSWQLYIRHAHRDNSDRSVDNGLSEKGRTQGGELVRQLERETSAFEPVRRLRAIHSSPRLRCVETAKFVAEWAGLEVKIDERLDERHPDEDERAFRARLHGFWAAEKGRTAICYVSHGDVLPEIADWGGLGRLDVRKAGHFWLELDD